jgi:hypothetical protein
MSSTHNLNLIYMESNSFSHEYDQIIYHVVLISKYLKNIVYKKRIKRIVCLYLPAFIRRKSTKFILWE